MSRGWAPTGPAEPISIHGAGGSASSEKGARPWGARRRRRGRRGATGTLTRPRGGAAAASCQQPDSESSRQEEPPSGGSTPLGEREESVRRGEGARRGTCVARGRLRSGGPSTTAAPRPTSPGAVPGSPLASVPLPRLAGRPSLASRAQAVQPRRRCGRGRRRGRRGGVGEQAARRGGAWRTRGGARPPPGSAGRRQPGGAGLEPPRCGSPPACDVAEGGAAYLGRSLPGARLVRGQWPPCRGPPSFPSPLPPRPARATPRAPFSASGQATTTVDRSKSVGLL